MKLFLSHSWEDKKLPAFKIIENGLSDAFEVWVDKKGIQFGQSLQERIREGIASSDAFIVLWSVNSARSPEVLKEIRAAQDLAKLIIPVRISDLDPGIYPPFRDLLYVDMSEKRFDLPWLNTAFLKLKNQLHDLNMKRNPGKIPALFDNFNKIQAQALDHLQDIEHRMNKNQNSGPGSEAYMLPALKSMKMMLDAGFTPEPERSRLHNFFSELEGIMANLSEGPDRNFFAEMSVLGAIYKVDPLGESPLLSTLKSAFQESTRKHIEDQNQKLREMLSKSGSTSTEKQEKPKSVLDDLPPLPKVDLSWMDRISPIPPKDQPRPDPLDDLSNSPWIEDRIDALKFQLGLWGTSDWNKY